MQNLGGGVTFSENDHEMAKLVLGLINQAKYTLAPQQILQAAQALNWYRQLVEAVEANIFEIKKVVNTNQDLLPVETKGKGKK
jgi:hypothetical protein